MDISDLHLEIGKTIAGIADIRKDIAELQISHSNRIDILTRDVEALQEKASMGKGVLWVLGIGSSFGFVQMVNRILQLIKS